MAETPIDPVIATERKVFLEDGIKGLLAYWDEWLNANPITIGIGMPCFRGFVNVFCIAGLMEARTPPSTFFTSVGSLAYTAREICVVNALKTPDWDYLIWIDDDVRIPFFGIMRMVQRAKEYPLQTGLVCFRKMPIMWSIYDTEYDEKGKRTLLDIHERGRPITDIAAPYRDRMVEVGAAGMAFCLTSRTVFEKMTPPYFQPWDPVHQEVVGEDIFFWERCRREGWKIFADTSNMAEHFEGIISYPGILFKTGRFRCPI